MDYMHVRMVLEEKRPVEMVFVGDAPQYCGGRTRDAMEACDVG